MEERHEPGPDHRRLAGASRAAGRHAPLGRDRWSSASRSTPTRAQRPAHPGHGRTRWPRSGWVCWSATAGRSPSGRARSSPSGRTRPAALLAKTGLPYLLAVPPPALVTFLLGLAFGIPALRLRGLYLALVTLALAVAVGPVIKRAEPLTGGVSGLAGAATAGAVLAGGRPGPVALPAQPGGDRGDGAARGEPDPRQPGPVAGRDPRRRAGRPHRRHRRGPGQGAAVRLRRGVRGGRRRAVRVRAGLRRAGVVHARCCPSPSSAPWSSAGSAR